MRDYHFFHIAMLYEISISWYNTHMQKAYRFRLYPTAEQTQMMTRIIGCCRFTYNRLLEYCSKSYKRRGESHTSFDLNNFICHTLKKAYPWLSDAPAQTLQCVSADLSAAFKAFFRKDASYPKYKSKHRSKKNFRIPQRGKVDVKGNRIYIQGVGWVKAVVHRTPIGRLKNIPYLIIKRWLESTSTSNGWQYARTERIMRIQGC